MKARRIAVAAFLAADGIASVAVVPVAWGGQGFTATTSAAVEGRAAATFPGASKSATTVPAAAVPQVIQPPAPAASTPTVKATPATPHSSKTPRPSRSAKPSASPSATKSTGN